MSGGQGCGEWGGGLGGAGRRPRGSGAEASGEWGGGLGGVGGRGRPGKRSGCWTCGDLVRGAAGGGRRSLGMRGCAGRPPPRSGSGGLVGFWASEPRLNLILQTQTGRERRGAGPDACRRPATGPTARSVGDLVLVRRAQGGRSGNVAKPRDRSDRPERRGSGLGPESAGGPLRERGEAQRPERPPGASGIWSWSGERRGAAPGTWRSPETGATPRSVGDSGLGPESAGGPLRERGEAQRPERPPGALGVVSGGGILSVIWMDGPRGRSGLWATGETTAAARSSGTRGDGGFPDKTPRL